MVEIVEHLNMGLGENFVEAGMMLLGGSPVYCQMDWSVVKLDCKTAEQVRSIYKPFRHIFLLVHDELSNRKLFCQQDSPLNIFSILIENKNKVFFT